MWVTRTSNTRVYIRVKERTEFSNYRGISLLGVVGIIYAGNLVNRVRRVTGEFD